MSAPIWAWRRRRAERRSRLSVTLQTQLAQLERDVPSGKPLDDGTVWCGRGTRHFTMAGGTAVPPRNVVEERWTVAWGGRWRYHIVLEDES